MKKILIWLLLFNIIVFSEEIDLLKQMDDSKYEENAVNFKKKLDVSQWLLLIDE